MMQYGLINASLLHLDNTELNEIILKIVLSLKENGYIYLSFKYGDSEREKNGRFFNDMNEEKFNNILENFKNLKLIEYKITNCACNVKTDEQWLNIVLKKI